MKSSPPSPGSSRLIASSIAVWAMASLADRTPTPWNRKSTQASWRRGSYRENLQRTFPSCTVLQRSFTWTGASFGAGTFRNLRSRRARCISYRQPTTWERYGKYIGAVLLLILVQAMLIIGLLWQRARNRKADLRLRESEKRFRLMADTTPALVWMCDREGTVTYLNDRRIDFTGRDLATGFGDVWSAFIHPDDVAERPDGKQTWRSNSRKGIPRNTGFAGGMECTDGCWISRRRALTRMAHLPGLLVRRWTSQTRNWHRKRWRKSVAN